MKKDRKIQITFLLFVLFAVWRAILFMMPSVEGFNPWSFAWGASYQVIAIWGAVIGFIVAKSWGGWKSTFGRMVSLFSIGLLFQSLGQALSSFYVFKTGDVPYPGWGDIGFFGSIIFYIFGVFLLAKVSGVKASIKSFRNKIQAVLIPVIMVGASYFIFLKGYQYDWSNPVQTFLDFGYPVYQAIYVAIAVLTLILSREYLGGMMKKPIMFFLGALIMQYLSDFVFLYQASRNLYIPEGVNDCMYFVSYFLMAIALIYTGITFKKITQS